MSSDPVNPTESGAPDLLRPIRDGESGVFALRLRDAIGDEPVAAFARRCRLAESVLRSYLNDGKQPRMDYLVAIAEAGGVTVDWLATGRGPKRRPSNDAASAPIPDRRWAKLIELVEGIDDEATRAAALDDLFARAQDLAERDTLRKAISDLQKALKRGR